MRKEVFLKLVEAQEKEWEAELKHLQSKAAMFQAEAMIEYDQNMKNLQQKLKESERAIENIKQIADDSWQDIESTIRGTWNEITSAIDNIISKFK